MITLSGKGGYFTSHPGSGGYYLGGQGKFYPDPDLALHAGIDYTKFCACPQLQRDRLLGGHRISVAVVRSHVGLRALLLQ